MNAQVNTESPQTPASTVAAGRLWNMKEICQFIGCSPRQITNLRYAGMPTIKIRHLIRFEPEVVKEWLRQRSSM